MCKRLATYFLKMDLVASEEPQVWFQFCTLMCPSVPRQETDPHIAPSPVNGSSRHLWQGGISRCDSELNGL